MFHFFPSPPVAFVGRVRRPSHGSSIDRSVSRRSKPDDPRRSIRRITTRRFGRDTPKTSHPIGRARVDIASTFSPGRPMDARARIHPSIVARRSSAVLSLRGVKPPFVERVASRERASVRLDRSVGFARMDGWIVLQRGWLACAARYGFWFGFFITDEPLVGFLFQDGATDDDAVTFIALM